MTAPLRFPGARYGRIVLDDTSDRYGTVARSGLMPDDVFAVFETELCRLVQWTTGDNDDSYPPCFLVYRVGGSGFLVAMLSDAGTDRRGRPHSMRIDAACIAAERLPEDDGERRRFVASLCRPEAWNECDPQRDDGICTLTVADSPDDTYDREIADTLEDTACRSLFVATHAAYTVRNVDRVVENVVERVVENVVGPVAEPSLDKASLDKPSLDKASLNEPPLKDAPSAACPPQAGRAGASPRPGEPAFDKTETQETKRKTGCVTLIVVTLVVTNVLLCFSLVLMSNRLRFEAREGRWSSLEISSLKRDVKRLDGQNADLNVKLGQSEAKATEALRELETLKRDKVDLLAKNRAFEDQNEELGRIMRSRADSTGKVRIDQLENEVRRYAGLKEEYEKALDEFDAKVRELRRHWQNDPARPPISERP